jgi:hypothetical protein
LRLAAFNIIEDDEFGRSPCRHRGQRQDAHLHVRATCSPLSAGELLTVLIKDRRIIWRSVGPAQDRLGYHEAEPLALVVEDALPVNPAHDPIGEVGGRPRRGAVGRGRGRGVRDRRAGGVRSGTSLGGLADSTIRNDTGHLDLIPDWFGRPPGDAARGSRRLLRQGAAGREAVDAHGRAAALAVFLQFLELRHQVEIYDLTGRVAECPLDEVNRPRASVDPQLRVPRAGQGAAACFREDTEDINRERAETYLRQLAEAELRATTLPRPGFRVGRIPPGSH